MIHVNENCITEHRSSGAVSTTKHIGHQLVAAISKQARVLHSLEAVNQLPQSAIKPMYYIAYVCHQLIAAVSKSPKNSA